MCYSLPYGVDSIIYILQMGILRLDNIKKLALGVQCGCPCMRVTVCATASQALSGWESQAPQMHKFQQRVQWIDYQDGT